MSGIFSFKTIIPFFIGVALVSIIWYSSAKIKSFFNSDTETVKEESIILSSEEIAAKFYKHDSIPLINIPSNGAMIPAFSGIKTITSFYHPNSKCIIEAESNANFDGSSSGKPYTTRIVAFDFNSEEARVECSKIAMEHVLPLILRGAFADIIKGKVLSDGTINKIFNQGKQAESQKADAVLDVSQMQIVDSGFVIENLNIGIVLTPYRFEIYITDCSAVKCGV